MGRLAYILAGAVFIIALGMVGRADFNDEIREAVYYCDMVEAGHWPNYEPGTDCAKVRASAAEHLTEGR
jgi:hypothetical protein